MLDRMRFFSRSDVQDSDDGIDFFRGLAFALPVSFLMWSALFAALHFEFGL